MVNIFKTLDVVRDLFVYLNLGHLCSRFYISWDNLVAKISAQAPFVQIVKHQPQVWRKEGHLWVDDGIVIVLETAAHLFKSDSKRFI